MTDKADEFPGWSKMESIQQYNIVERLEALETTANLPAPMSKRELFAAMADVPWNAAMETLRIKGIGAPSVQEVVEQRALMMTAQADALLAALEADGGPS